MRNYNKVLVLTAHPDDLELACGGTVKKFVDEGIQVDNAILCGDVPHADGLMIPQKFRI